MHKYGEIITDEPRMLKTLEKKHRHSVIGKRLEMLRKLKTGEARSLADAARQINYSLRQCQRWFKRYQAQGLASLLEAPKQGHHSSERMTQAAWEALNEALGKAEIGTYKQARELLAKQGVVYKDDTSILKLFKRHGIKAKTGRPVHEKADIEAQVAFKKTLPRP